MEVTQANEATVVGNNVQVLQLKHGENLIFRRVLHNPETKETKNPEHRNKVLKTK